MDWLFKIRNYNRLMKLCEEILEFSQHGDYSNGITGQGGYPDEGDVRAGEMQKYLEDKVKSLYTPGRRLQEKVTEILSGR